MSDRTPVILVGLDSTEIDCIEALMNEGRLPHLASLRARGYWSELRTRPRAFLSMVWPTFFTGTNVSHHGWYFNKLWRADRMRLEYARPDWLPLDPFWTALDPEYRVALLDVPFSTKPPADLNGVFINGWQNHDDFGRHAKPASLFGDLVRQFGRPEMNPEFFGHQDARSLLRQRREVLAATEQFGRLSAHMLAREPWDLFVTVFGAAHRGAHYLWDLSQIDIDGVSPENLATLRRARDELLVASDEAVGRLLDAAPPDARIMIFALHGMGPNTGWSEHFGRIVTHMQGGGGDGEEKPRAGLVYRVKKALPWKLVRQVTTRLPSAVNHALVPLWSRRMYDWTTTRFFPLPLDLNGYLRINLAGRETAGLVQPGSEYEDLLDELTAGFTSFRDIETGAPVVECVERVDDLVGSDAPCRDVLPDLVVCWSDQSSRDSAGITSEIYGDVRWERGGRLPSGRSGNHLERGWLIAAGPGIEPRVAEDIHDTVELIPTAFEWIGAARPERFHGRPIQDLVAEPSAASTTSS